MTSVFCATPACADAELSTAEKLVRTAEFAVFSAWEMMAAGYRTAPALMLGLAMLIAVPVLAIASRTAVVLRRSPEATRRWRGSKVLEGDVKVAMAENAGEAAIPRSGHAFLEIVGAANARFAILSDMLRIGREDDNDIRIPSSRVHRYHAAILREEFGCYHITDLTGFDGDGVLVNGKRCAQAQLNDGDVIELGPGCLRFHAGLV